MVITILDVALFAEFGDSNSGVVAFTLSVSVFFLIEILLRGFCHATIAGELYTFIRDP